MSGTIPLSMTQQFDVYGKPLAAGQLYLIQVGTVSTPQDGFQDPGLTVKMPYPMTLDAAGRVPQFFVADGYVKVRLQDRNGVVQLAADSVLVIGPSSGGGGGSTVDPTQLVQTGDIKARYGVGSISGYVRLNGLSIGNAVSGATERQNADTQALFLYLYGVDTSLVLKDSGQNVIARTTAANDFNTSRNLALPDWRGYAIGALDDMGNAAAGRLSATYFGSSAIVLGAVGGAESRVLLPNQVQIPQHAHAVYLKDNGHNHAMANIAYRQAGGAGIVFYTVSGPDGYTPLTIDAAPLIKNAFSGITIGSVPGVASDNGTALSPVGAAAAPHAAIGPRKLCTVYMKL